MRFCDHLQRWLATGEYPAIHDQLADLITSSEQKPLRLADIGACHGLLGASVGAVVGIEADHKRVAEARAARVPLPMVPLKITRATLPTLSGILRDYNVDGVILRRVMPELWGKDVEGARLFALALQAAGVRAIFLQGRAPTKRATAHFHNVQTEITALHGFQTVRLAGQCAELAHQNEGLQRLPS